MTVQRVAVNNPYGSGGHGSHPVGASCQKAGIWGRAWSSVPGFQFIAGLVPSNQSFIPSRYGASSLYSLAFRNDPAAARDGTTTGPKPDWKAPGLACLLSGNGSDPPRNENNLGSTPIPKSRPQNWCVLRRAGSAQDPGLTSLSSGFCFRSRATAHPLSAGDRSTRIRERLPLQRMKDGISETISGEFDQWANRQSSVVAPMSQEDAVCDTLAVPR